MNKKKIKYFLKNKIWSSSPRRVKHGSSEVQFSFFSLVVRCCHTFIIVFAHVVFPFQAIPFFLPVCLKVTVTLH